MLTPDYLERLPPSDIAAEQGVLGSILIDPTVLADLADLRPEHFYADANARIYRHLGELFSAASQTDTVLLLARLKDAGDLEAIGGMAYIAEVARLVPYASNAKYYAGIVRDKAAWRGIIQACTDGLRRAYEEDGTPTDAVSEITAAVQAADAGAQDERPVKASAAAIEALDRVDEIQSGRAAAGAMIGLENFDRAIGGLFAGELTILAARPGEGKTALASQIGWHFAARGRGVYHASLEMNAREIMQRILCSQASVSSREIRTGTIGPESVSRLIEASNATYDMPWWFHSKLRLTVPELVRWVQRTQRKRSLSLVIVDYLQLLTPTAGNKGENREQQVARMSRQLKGLAVECNVSVLCLAQLNRGLPGDREPSLKMLRESGAIEQDADMVMVPWGYAWKAKDAADLDAKAEEDAAKARGDHWHPLRKHLYLLKNRNGECGRFALDWIPARTLFVERSVSGFNEFDDFT